MNTGVEGTEELRRSNEGNIRHSNVWIVQGDTDDLWFQLGAAFSCVSQGRSPRNEHYPLSLGSSNDFGSRSEEVDSMPIVWSPPVDSTSDVVYNRGVVSVSNYALCVDGVDGRCPQQKRGFTVSSRVEFCVVDIDGRCPQRK